jgi:hypothetical protein
MTLSSKAELDVEICDSKRNRFYRLRKTLKDQ